MGKVSPKLKAILDLLNKKKPQKRSNDYQVTLNIPPNEALRYLKHTKISSTQNQNYNISNQMKNYQACKEIGKYSPLCAENAIIKQKE